MRLLSESDNTITPPPNDRFARVSHVINTVNGGPAMVACSLSPGLHSFKHTLAGGVPHTRLFYRPTAYAAKRADNQITLCSAWLDSMKLRP